MEATMLGRATRAEVAKERRDLGPFLFVAHVLKDLGI
jgi:hypothetical protein